MYSRSRLGGLSLAVACTLAVAGTVAGGAIAVGPSDTAAPEMDVTVAEQIYLTAEAPAGPRTFSFPSPWTSTADLDVEVMTNVDYQLSASRSVPSTGCDRLDVQVKNTQGQPSYSPSAGPNSPPGDVFLGSGIGANDFDRNDTVTLNKNGTTAQTVVYSTYGTLAGAEVTPYNRTRVGGSTDTYGVQYIVPGNVTAPAGSCAVTVTWTAFVPNPA